MSTSDELSKALDLSLEERMKRGERSRVLQSENALLTARLVAATGLLQEIEAFDPGMEADDQRQEWWDRLNAYLAAERPEAALLEDLRAAYEALNRLYFWERDIRDPKPKAEVLGLSEPSPESSYLMGPWLRDNIDDPVEHALAALKRWLPEAAS